MYSEGDIVEMKKVHPCGSSSWRIIRIGMDVKLCCEGCQRIVTLPRRKFESTVKSKK